MNGAANAGRGRRAQELGFRIGLALKAIDGLIEVAVGLLLWFAPGVLRTLSAAVANESDHGPDRHELVEHWAGRLSEALAAGAPVTVIVFLLSHGTLKLLLVYCLLRDYRWAYRPALVILGLFAVYQLVVLIGAPTPVKAVLLLLDVVIIWLVWREWRARAGDADSTPAGRGTASWQGDAE
ncbi:DUF2127 domain-containing protein [Microterricola viridarii]|uniref:DUF2127 domain-containing protein n=1 Tax=Microterricola viridarii TaxID=412690 RepID=A0A109QXN8_9MICO|nr:DUF2127 domain-containing protein [Microterricola viridarii]AMB58578.1 hypothetical protein AWU67_06570 [Microterricola viridarii]